MQLGSRDSVLQSQLFAFLTSYYLKIFGYLMQPGSRDSVLQCYIKRNRSNQTYYLYLGLNQGK